MELGLNVVGTVFTILIKYLHFVVFVTGVINSNITISYNSLRFSGVIY